MQRGETGRYEVTSVGGEHVRAFVPNPLPPTPRLVLEGALNRSLESALLGLGRLDGISAMLPDKPLFLYTYVRKEAVLSSQIEGTQSSLSDLLLFELDEAPDVPLADVVEVSNYVAALEHGLARLRQGFPLCSRLVREIHGVLLSRGRGSTKDPGEFRRSQCLHMILLGRLTRGDVCADALPLHFSPQILQRETAPLKGRDERRNNAQRPHVRIAKEKTQQELLGRAVCHQSDMPRCSLIDRHL